MNAKIDLEKFICSYVKCSNIQDALKDQGLKCWNGEIVEIESEDERIASAIRRFLETEKRENNLVGYFGVTYEEATAWLEKLGEKLQVDGFDAELNALLKKYEYLSKKELQEPLEFYLGVVRDDLDVVREEGKPKWTEEDSLMIDSIVDTIKWLEGEGATNMKIDWLKSLKQRMEE